MIFQVTFFKQEMLCLFKKTSLFLFTPGSTHLRSDSGPDWAVDVTYKFRAEFANRNTNLEDGKVNNALFYVSLNCGSAVDSALLTSVFHKIAAIPSKSPNTHRELKRVHVVSTIMPSLTPVNFLFNFRYKFSTDF